MRPYLNYFMRKNFYIFLAILLLGFYRPISAQNSLPRIDKEKLKAILDTSQARLNILTIFTNDCGGTKLMFENITKLKAKYPGQILFIPCSSERNVKEQGVLERLKKYQYTEICYLIDGDKYPEKKMDTRVKGYNFRNDVCKDCIIDQIGVPYYMLIEPGRHILYAGYTAPGDFDRLLEYIMQAKPLKE